LSQTNELKKKIQKTIDSYKPIVNETMNQAIKMTFKVSLEGDNLQANEEQEKKEIETLSKQMQKQNDKDLEMLTKLSVFAFKKDVLNTYSNFKRSGEYLMQSIESTIDRLKNPANTPKVTYSNGRKVSWKSYMEMNVRTTLNQKATEYQMSVGKYNGVVFYTTQVLQDCADDHFNYQGKYSMIEKQYQD
jgi:Phage minor capsid protein 2.